MEPIFEFLFKYRSLLFREGRFTLTAPGSVRVWIAVLGAAGVVGALTYAMARGRTGRFDRGVMACLRLSLFAILAFCLLQPALLLSTVVPRRNFVGILIDDSRSMRLPAEQGGSRGDVARAAFAPGDSDLLRTLGERFNLRFFRFSSAAARLGGPDELTFEGTHTDLAGALDLAREELAGLPLSALVIVTDGADNRDRPLAGSLVPLQAAGVPVFTVGLGAERLAPDVQIDRVEAPRTVLEGTTLVADVAVSHAGFRGAKVAVIAEEAGHLLARTKVVLPGDGETVIARLRFPVEDAGAHTIRFSVPVQPGEQVERNNARHVVLYVRGEREKILYFEGEPRFEVKFIRRAVHEDPNLQVVVLQRTAENKFLRLAVDDRDELAGGFPHTRAELYRYRALILGSVEASFFTHDQLRMIADFAGERGGGVLFLGGRDAFAEGGWAGTPVEEVMPVVLGDPVTPHGTFFAEVRVEPTPAGLAHPATQLGGGGEDPRARWASLPAVSVANPISGVKPGATTLLVGHGEGLSHDQVVLAHQRYGRGRSLALTIQDSWLWQMHAGVPLEDRSHEAFWQQLLRWLVDGVPEPVVASLARDEAEPGEPVRITAEVTDSAYIEVNDAVVTARVTGPDDVQEEVPLVWDAERDGRYTATFAPPVPGDYTVAVRAERDGHEVGRAAAPLSAGPSPDEYFDAGRRTATLRRIADETGGRFYTPETLGDLPEDIDVKGAGVTLVEQKDLWDMPVLFLAILTLLGAEWGYRRMRGLA